MPRIIYKSAPELDEYVWWTTVSDGPVSGVLTRDQMHAYLLKETSMTADEVEERLQRTDEAGSSWESRTPMWDTEHYARMHRFAGLIAASFVGWHGTVCGHG
ncbi:hypothetical protein [Rhodococcus pyridinivorans]|uniref:hypothetical protein n=1 Tax=Rhodococcus pyridinivorans TaxID=103816 RepID=UPI003AB0C054